MFPLLRRTLATAASFKRPSLIASHLFRTSAAAEIKQTGLYGFEHLKSPKGFQRFADDAIERAGELVNYISGTPSASEIVRAMDEISDAVCSVVDSAELCRHTHPDREFVEAAMDAAMRMEGYIHVRRTVYVKGNSVPRANLAVLDKLMAARHELAEIMGCKSYAEFSVRSNMASSQEVVMSSLIEMSEVVRCKAEEEFKMIKSFKREHTCDTYEDLDPWDETYYTAMMKSSTCGLDSTVVSSYFPVAQCLKGLNVLVESLFGATLQKIPLSPGESWHPDVIKMSLHHPEEGDLGFLYLDLYSRKGKYLGCAHFAIKGGRQISETEYQLPVVALVCNFSRSSTVRLNHSEVETLLHEFGHALHSLLSRTDHQHFSGTRVALDLAETPSNFFEYFAWDYRFLQTFATHYSTGEVIPEKLVNLMVDAKNMFAATEFQRQVFYAMIDQKLFGDLPFPRDTVSMVADLKRSYTSWKHVDGTHWHTRFSHLLNYGAGYYSYLFAKCFAATIWQRLFQEEPLSREAGTALRTKFLQLGGSREPVDLLTGLVGNGIIRHHKGGVIPDLTALCQEMKL